jgi:transcriptional regulator with XRE-family HTH domain
MEKQLNQNTHIIGQKIKKMRESKNMSLREFGNLVKLSHANIDRFEKGYDSKGVVKGSIQIDDLKQICDKTGYSFRQFLEEAGYIEPIVKNEQSQEILQLFEQLTRDERYQVIGFAKNILQR